MRGSSRTKKGRSTRRKESNFLSREVLFPDEETFSKFQESFRWLCRELNKTTSNDPPPPSEYLGMVGRITTRQANNVLGRKQGVTLKVLWRLLSTDHGPRFLNIMLACLQTEWAKQSLHQQKIAEQKKIAREAERKLKELEALS